MLWFKNLILYRLERPVFTTAERLEEQLSAFSFSPCGSQDKTKIGWVAPIGQTLVFESQGQFLLCLRKEEKVLPASVVNDKVKEKQEKQEKIQGRKLKKAEKTALKEEVFLDLLPRAFSRFSQMYLWIDTLQHRILIDTQSATKAETALALLRKSLGSLPLVPMIKPGILTPFLTSWVKDGATPADWELLDEAELKAIDAEGGILRCKKHALDAKEILQHIEAGKQVTQLALDWQTRLQCILTESGIIKRLKCSETLKEENQDIDRDDVAQRFDADFALMTGELSKVIDSLEEIIKTKTNEENNDHLIEGAEVI